MTKLKFKLHVVSDEDEIKIYKEVRKINIDVTSVTNLKNLHEKVSAIFPKLYDDFDIFWEDEEDTIITIATDEELEIALKEIAAKNGWNNVYNLFILLSKRTSWRFRPSIKSIENNSCEDILSFQVCRAMGNKLMFKLHVDTTYPWICNEVRKVNIDVDVVLNLANLYKKLQTIFPILQDRNFIVTWKDKECEKYSGMYITIATREELALALEEMYWIAKENNKNFYNLYIWLLKYDKDQD
ncbi:uncharacterized protein LOC105204022 [Solenopsis invicta]|uniref:uncharacterized protein LOC105204022 n=1 Tax=Solenopsis invicta TaxID=13686 RepID=UPI00059616FC|nr:uncharacterized protein LOC105204022 [Solenopsis invicta]